jgi:hypothetical protein
LSPILRHSLGSKNNSLPFRELLDDGRSLIVSLARPVPDDTKRLLGCLLTVGMESAALSRADIRTGRVPHHMIIDEFSQFMAQSENALTRMLSETRKYGLFCVMAHQNWSQASERLRGALQNVGVEMILKTGRFDAEYSAHILGSVDPMERKHVVEDDKAEERTHPVYLSLPEQWERHVQGIQRLKVGQAYVRLPDDSVHKVSTPTLPRVALDLERLYEVQETYLSRYFEPVDRTALAPYEVLADVPPIIGRRSPAQRSEQTIYSAGARVADERP